MTALATMQAFIENLDAKQFKIASFPFLAVVIIAMSVIMYRYQRTVTTLEERIAQINRKRKEVKEILERFNSVKKQQAEVDTLLAQDKNFKIASYFNDVMAQLSIVQNKQREPDISSAELDNGYTEIKLYARFANLNTQQLATLLDTLEQNERIYTKEIEINKLTQDPTINVNIVIATLEPKQEPVATTV